MLQQIKNGIIANTITKLKTYYQDIIALPGSRKKIAQGVALGMAFDFLPIPIISIPLSYVAARLLRCNPVAAVGTVIFFKLAVPLFYALDALTGEFLFGGISGPSVEFVTNHAILEFFEGILERVYSFLLGCLVNAAIVYFVVYFILNKLINRKNTTSE